GRRCIMTTRAAIYARVSTDMQSETSTQDQAADCHDYAKRNGWTVVAEYADIAISGTNVHRPQYQRLLADIKAARDPSQRPFDIVVGESMSRLGRDLEDAAALYKRITFLGIKLFTIHGGEIDDLKLAIYSGMAQSHVKKLAEDVKRGQRGRVRAG